MKNESIHVLIVDDDAMLCDAIADLFGQFNFTVSMAYSAKEALELIRSENISIVISDVHMPEHDGFWLLNEIKKLNNEFPKVLFISGKNINIPLAYNQGIEGFFEKPFDLEQVKGAIKKCLMRKKDWWGLPFNSQCSRISKRFYDWEELIKSNQVGFGKGGLFLGQNKDLLQVGDLCEFKIEFVSCDPIRKIQGQGMVKWVRAEEECSSGETSGMGIEIVHLNRDCIKFYSDAVRSFGGVEYIPMGPNGLLLKAAG